jgi:UPF0755 protein
LYKKYSFLNFKNANDRRYKFEGYLFPDRYIFHKNLKPSEVIDIFLKNYERRVTQKKYGINNQSIAELCRQNKISLDYATKIASLLQCEAADKNDLRMVSSVIHNRLRTIKRKGINKFNERGLCLLSLCSTVAYPGRKVPRVKNSIQSAFRSNKYNTYFHKGLPPSAISNPGRDALLAAILPAKTDYYYFCHSQKTRRSYYARTLKEHYENRKAAHL